LGFEDPVCHGALSDGRSEVIRSILVYHLCLLIEVIYEVVLYEEVIIYQDCT
jgi:hypothetical protein